MSYTVIARKYRPQKFVDITAQEHITRTLQNAIRTGRVAHGYIFSGSRGVGKTTLARILAKALNCEKILTDETYRTEVAEPCGECESCCDFNDGASLNIYELDAASNNGVEDVRLLRENVRYAPQKGKYKVYIIDEFHMLSKAAFNAFLKTLEEPPPHAIFIFATTELQDVPATISSRCQRFIFKRISVQDIADTLESICKKENITIDRDSLTLIARKADGAMRDAQSLLDQVISFSLQESCDKTINITYQTTSSLLNILDEEHFFTVTDAIVEKNPAKMIEVSSYIYENGFDIPDFLQKLIGHFRNFLIIKNLRSSKLIETTEVYRKRYEEDAKHFEADILLQFVDVVTQAEREIKNFREPQLKLELTLLKLIKVSELGTYEARIASLEKAVQALSEELKKKIADESITIAHANASPKPKVQPRDLERVSQSLNVAAWQGRFSRFIQETTYRPRYIGSRPLAKEREAPAENDTQNLISKDVLNTHWRSFIESLESEGKSFLVSHLKMCEMEVVRDGKVLLKCGRKFSFESLQTDSTELHQEAVKFFGGLLEIDIVLDKTSVAEALKSEKSAAELFKELSETNPVIKYLIEHFGAEPLY